MPSCSLIAKKPTPQQFCHSIGCVQVSVLWGFLLADLGSQDVRDPISRFTITSTRILIFDALVPVSALAACVTQSKDSTNYRDASWSTQALEEPKENHISRSSVDSFCWCKWSMQVLEVVRRDTDPRIEKRIS